MVDVDRSLTYVDKKYLLHLKLRERCEFILLLTKKLKFASLLRLDCDHL